MNKRKIYERQDGKRVIATFYRANVAWRVEGKGFNSGIDSIETFFRKMASQGWKEVVA